MDTPELPTQLRQRAVATAGAPYSGSDWAAADWRAQASNSSRSFLRSCGAAGRGGLDRLARTGGGSAGAPIASFSCCLRCATAWLSHFSAASTRSQPGSTAPRFTSRQLGWRSGGRESADGGEQGRRVSCNAPRLLAAPCWPSARRPRQRSRRWHRAVSVPDSPPPQTPPARSLRPGSAWNGRLKRRKLPFFGSAETWPGACRPPAPRRRSFRRAPPPRRQPAPWARSQQRCRGA